MTRFFSDIFRGPNGHWDFGRFAAFHSLTAYTLSFLYALFVMHKVPDWNDLGIGYAAVMSGAGILIGVKDIAVAKANATAEGSQNV